jgi:hypothetical protein
MAKIVSYKTIKTNAMDTFDMIALRECGSEYKASDIMQINPDYCDVIFFGENTELTIPVYEVNMTPDTLPPWRRAE